MDWLTLLGWAKTTYGYLQNVKEAYDGLQNLLNKTGASAEQKLQEGFKQLSKDLQEIHQDLSNLILSAEVRLQYVGCEDEIWRAADCFLTYLRDRGSQFKKDTFLERGEDLRNAVRTLMEGILGQRSLRTDLLAAIVELEKERPERIRKRIGPFVELVNAGILLHAAYVQVSKNPEADYKDTFASLYSSMMARIDGQILDEVPNEMANIMDSFPSFTSYGLGVSVDTERERLAEKIHHHLSDRYYSHQWLVIVFGTECFLEPGSPGWHCSPPVKGRCAFAKSFPLDYRPAPFQVPTSPLFLRWRSWSKYLLTLPSLLLFLPTFDDKTESDTGSMEKLARELSRSQPGNTYLVMRKSLICYTPLYKSSLMTRAIVPFADPVVKPSCSPLVREVQVGDHYKVIACPLGSS